MFKKLLIKNIILLFLLLITQLSAYSAENDLNSINIIESRLFNQNFNTETIDKRLDRIEQTAFGMTYNDDLNRRLSRISSLSKTFNPIDLRNIAQNADQYNSYVEDKSATDYPVVTQIEIKIFHQGFTRENIYSRLNRLENKVFGSIFPNENLSDRVDRLKSAIGENDPDMSYSDEAPAIISSNDSSNGAVYNNLSDIELKLFGQTFDNNLITERIDRIERKVFGAIQSGMTDSRLSRINAVVQNKFIPPENFSNNANNYANQMYQSKSSTLGNNFLSSNYNDWNDEFFTDQPQNQAVMSAQKSGVMNFLQALAVPFIMGFMNRNNSYSVPPSYENYYPYNSPYSNYGRNYSYLPPNYNYQYPVNNFGYPGSSSGYYGNSYAVNGYGPQSQVQTITRGLLQNNMGVGVHILP